ncbi:DUF397 domain-containing protein [Spirillospora sp. CA-294931]|uniref:DUF397 domain-containing protein n=1 Tax=Spirillospora sp. CA-294931 TaxID=3240042 RepID=UPI003D8C4700
MITGQALGRRIMTPGLQSASAHSPAGHPPHPIERPDSGKGLRTADGTIGVRHSKAPCDPVLELTSVQWAALVSALRSHR